VPLAADPGLRVIGEARDISSGELVYREYHYTLTNTGQHLVEYRDTTGGVLASKLLDYSVAAIAPAVHQLDRRSGQWLYAQWQGPYLSMGHRVDYEAVLERQTIEADTTPVVDAGFDNFIRQHWAELIGGDSVNFDFAVPTRFGTVALSARRKSCDAAATPAGVTCFRVKPQNWLLGLLMQAIDLQYRLDTRQLLRFEGLSNINDPRGDAMTVTINYRYPEPDDLLADEQAPLIDWWPPLKSS
jgi:hypothetical protein